MINLNIWYFCLLIASVFFYSHAEQLQKKIEQLEKENEKLHKQVQHYKMGLGTTYHFM